MCIIKAKFFVYALVALILAAVYSAEAQQPKKVPRIGFLDPGLPGPSPRVDGFRQGLRDLGWVEGQNILIDYRYAEAQLDRLPELAAELVHLKVGVIVTGGGPPSRAA